jgi:osmotically inducible protein OsmC
MKILYTAHATATGEGRDGHVTSSDGVLDLDLAVPQEMGGEGGPHTNPEQLFAAGYAACFHNALRRVARRAGKDVGDSRVDAEVGIGAGKPPARFALAVTLTATLPGISPAEAEELLRMADLACPYSNAVRGNVDVQVQLA